jgi:hypothetical protein
MSNREAQVQPVSRSMQMMRILWPGAMAVQAIHVAAKFALADLVASGPKSIKELAEAIIRMARRWAGYCGRSRASGSSSRTRRAGIDKPR